VSLARPIHPGTRYLITRRVAHRQFLLRPCEATNEILLYALAYAACVSGVIVHAFTSMSNHIHVVVTDPSGRLPVFLHALDRHIACCMNDFLGRRENFWASTSASAVALESDNAVLDKIAYVIANPVRAGLVASPEEWPGVMTPPAGMRVTARRPKVFYRAKGKMPVSIELQVSPPALSSYPSFEAVIAKIEELVDVKVRAAREEMKAEGRSFLGPKRVLQMDRNATASSRESVRSLRPRFSAQQPSERRTALEQLRVFHASYARALRAWRDGDRGVAFPAGTYLMHVQHGVVVESLAAAA
jgi:REP element-mobilizing transposase RayT